MGFPGGATGKEPACQVRRYRRRGFDHWVGKILWRRTWKPTPVFLPGESMDRGAWRATVHRVTKSRTWLKQLALMNEWVIMCRYLTSLSRDFPGPRSTFFLLQHKNNMGQIRLIKSPAPVSSHHPEHSQFAARAMKRLFLQDYILAAADLTLGWVFSLEHIS